MKKTFNAPEMDVKNFTVEDIITVSGGGSNNNNSGGDTGEFDGEWITF